jgi:hypothetical protein
MYVCASLIGVKHLNCVNLSIYNNDCIYALLSGVNDSVLLVRGYHTSLSLNICDFHLNYDCCCDTGVRGPFHSRENNQWIDDYRLLLDYGRLVEATVDS